MQVELLPEMSRKHIDRFFTDENGVKDHDILSIIDSLLNALKIAPQYLKIPIYFNRPGGQVKIDTIEFSPVTTQRDANIICYFNSRAALMRDFNGKYIYVPSTGNCLIYEIEASARRQQQFDKDSDAFICCIGYENCVDITSVFDAPIDGYIGVNNNSSSLYCNDELIE